VRSSWLPLHFKFKKQFRKIKVLYQEPKTQRQYYQAVEKHTPLAQELLSELQQYAAVSVLPDAAQQGQLHEGGMSYE
jgi:hypothetical protein